MHYFLIFFAVIIAALMVSVVIGEGEIRSAAGVKKRNCELNRMCVESGLDAYECAQKHGVCDE